MKQGQASQTAEVAAAMRAAESLRPEDERVCYDPLAEHFLSTKFRIIRRSRLLREIVLWITERMSPGGIGNKVASTRYFDDRVKASIDDGIRQLVNLGAWVTTGT